MRQFSNSAQSFLQCISEWTLCLIANQLPGYGRPQDMPKEKYLQFTKTLREIHLFCPSRLLLLFGSICEWIEWMFYSSVARTTLFVWFASALLLTMFASLINARLMWSLFKWMIDIRACRRMFTLRNIHIRCEYLEKCRALRTELSSLQAYLCFLVCRRWERWQLGDDTAPLCASVQEIVLSLIVICIGYFQLPQWFQSALSKYKYCCTVPLRIVLYSREGYSVRLYK